MAQIIVSQKDFGVLLLQWRLCVFLLKMISIIPLGVPADFKACCEMSVM